MGFLSTETGEVIGGILGAEAVCHRADTCLIWRMTPLLGGCRSDLLPKKWSKAPDWTGDGPVDQLSDGLPERGAPTAAPALTPPSLPAVGASKDSNASSTSWTREISALMSSRRRTRISSSRF